MSRFIPNENTFIGFTQGPVGVIAKPTGVTAAQAAGSLAPATLSYIVTAYNETGETTGSTAATTTVAAGTTGGAKVSWTAVDGAEGYRIYGRTGGSQSLIAQVGTVTTWTDSGAVDPSATVPPAVGTASNLESPTAADIAGCVELTEYVSGLNFAAQGNVVPTPNLKKLFETSIDGTSQATATMDCYRDDEIDVAWDTLPRRAKGYVVISRFGGIPNTVGDKCEVWPVRVSSRTNANLTNNTPATFTVTFAVVDAPAEEAVVVA